MQAPGKGSGKAKEQRVHGGYPFVCGIHPEENDASRAFSVFPLKINMFVD
ncbi:hypothetical protein RBY4I_3834 [Rhodobacterales bacterium Y4I]|nr:hypothetical protein RBY4I_3834 [Rhodobacterales bacterium Y4I]